MSKSEIVFKGQELPHETEAYKNNEKITLLHIINCKITSLPKRFGELRNLVELNLSRNKLAAVPECLEDNLLLLEVLDLSFNEIKEFAKVPRCYRKLRTVRVNNNRLQNIPKWVLQCECPNLTEFVYSFNDVVSLKDSTFDLCSNYSLKTLELVNCNLLEEDLTYIKRIRTLEELDLSNPKFCGKHLPYKLNEFVNCDVMFDKPSWMERLQVLKLNNLHISILSENISFLKKLRTLELTNNYLTWLPRYFPYLENLQTLDVSTNTIVCLPTDFGFLCNLRVLKVPHNHLVTIPDLIYLTNLKHLDAYDNDLDAFTHPTQQFEYIDLEQNYFCTHDLPDFDEYEPKKLKLRVEEAGRCNGKKQPLDETSDLQSTSSYSEYSEGGQYLEEGEFVEEESWDVVKKSGDCSSECSPSDEEWMGYETFPLKPKVKAVVKRTSLEDYVYVDAD